MGRPRSCPFLNVQTLRRSREEPITARSPSATLRIPALVIVMLVALGIPAVSRAASFPAASTGDIWFQADHAGFLGDDGEAIEEYYFRVPHNQLEFEEAQGDSGVFFRGKAFVSLVFLDDDEEELGTASGTFEFTAVDEAAALSADRVQLFLIREPLHPKTHEVRVEIEDLNARKRGLLYLITKKRRNGTARAVLIPPPFRGEEFGLSDIQFAWSVEPAAEGSHFEKRGFNVVPNPARSYGLYRDTLQIYYEVYDLKPPEGGAYVATRQILDDQGKVMRSAADTVVALGGQWVHTPRLSVKDLPAGTFDMLVEVAELGGTRSARVKRTFNVVWTESSWGRSEQDVLNEARILLPEDEYDRFREMQRGDRETHLANFWATYDPSPNTARNELRELFLQRVDMANRNFSTSFEKGLISDRGRIFIRYGQPDEVTREVMPQIGSSLSDYLEGISEDRPELETLKSGSSNVVDTRPFEVWSYTRQGEPLFLERETTTSSSGLTFIFVDEQGFGNYVLKYSSAFKKY